MKRTRLLILRITERCNLACRYCYAACSDTGDMNIDTAKKAIDLFAGAGDRLKIQFTGGEPLLCIKLMDEVSRYTRKQRINASFSVQTNGTMLNRESCAVLRAMGCAIGVSLDGIGDANSLRVYPDGSPAFPHTVNGIKALGTFRMQCNLNAVVTRVNQTHLDELVELAAYLGNVRGVGLDMFRPLGCGYGRDFMPDEAKLAHDIERMLQKAASLRELGMDIRIKEAEKMRLMVEHGLSGGCYCYAQTGESAAVDYNGDVYPCSSFVGLEKYRLGNIANEIRPLPSGVYELNGACVQCPYLPLCRGGCPAGRAADGTLSLCDCVMHKTFIDHERKHHG